MVEFKDISKGFLERSVLSWGVFDGVHKGHQKLLMTLRKLASSGAASSIIMIFDPHPEEVLYNRKIGLLTPLDEKLGYFAEFDPDIIVKVRFDRAFSELSPEEFVGEILKGFFGAKAIVLGEEPFFGNMRKGNASLLRDLASRLDIELFLVPYERYNGMVISSSLIRELIASGDLETAFLLLGKPPAIYGKIVKGDSIGKKLGYPTANLENYLGIKPPGGVYGCYVVFQGRRFQGVANIGKKPTFGGERELVEVHIIEPSFDEILYGKNIKIEFLFKVRDEHKFSTPEELSLQIAKDIKDVQRRISKEVGNAQAPGKKSNSF